MGTDLPGDGQLLRERPVLGNRPVQAIRVNQGDNGAYVIDGREIVGHEKLYDGFAEQDQYDFDEIFRTFDLDA